MPVSLRLLDATAAGTQTLRLLTALVCSVSVTTAVAGPMAYQAIEFRRSHDAIELSEDKTRIPTRVVDRAVLSPDTDGPPANLTRAATQPTIRATTTVAGGAAATTTAPPGPGPGEATAGGGTRAAEAAGQTQAPAPGGAATATTADGTVLPATVAAGQTDNAGQSPAAPAAVAVPTAPASTNDTSTSATTIDALQEFNPRPACDDRAQELNVGNTPVCTSTSPP